MHHHHSSPHPFDRILFGWIPICLYMLILLAGLSACTGMQNKPTVNCPAISASYWRECNDGSTANNFLDGRSDPNIQAVAPGKVSWAPGQSVSGYFHVSDALIDYLPSAEKKATVKYGFWGDGQSNVVIDNNKSAYFSVSSINATDFVHGNKLYSFDIICNAPGSGGYLMLTFDYYGPRLRTYIGSVTCRPTANQASPSATVG